MDRPPEPVLVSNGSPPRFRCDDSRTDCRRVPAELIGHPFRAHLLVEVPSVAAVGGAPTLPEKRGGRIVRRDSLQLSRPRPPQGFVSDTSSALGCTPRVCDGRQVPRGCRPSGEAEQVVDRWSSARLPYLKAMTWPSARMRNSAGSPRWSSPLPVAPWRLVALVKARHAAIQERGLTPPAETSFPRRRIQRRAPSRDRRSPNGRSLWWASMVSALEWKTTISRIPATRSSSVRAAMDRMCRLQTGQPG